jgi:single-strand DNA-binding protein
MNLNKVFLIGRVTRDIELKSLSSGQTVANLGLATNRVYIDKNGERKEETEFHSVVVYGRQAEICKQYLNKGSLVLIEGRLRTRNWDTPSGEKRYMTEIIAERIQLGPKSANQMPLTNKEQPEFQGINNQPEVEEELPELDINNDLPF